MAAHTLVAVVLHGATTVAMGQHTTATVATMAVAMAGGAGTGAATGSLTRGCGALVLKQVSATMVGCITTTTIVLLWASLGGMRTTPSRVRCGSVQRLLSFDGAL